MDCGGTTGMGAAGVISAEVSACMETDYYIYVGLGSGAAGTDCDTGNLSQFQNKVLISKIQKKEE
jgi:hypothetical protein